MSTTLINRQTALALLSGSGQAVTSAQLAELKSDRFSELLLITGAKLVMVPFVGAIPRRYAVFGYSADGRDRNLDRLTGAQR